MMTGHSAGAPPRDYSLSSDSQDHIFGIFSGIAIIATTYGNGIIPEIQVCSFFCTVDTGERDESEQFGRTFNCCFSCTILSGNSSSSCNRKDVQRPLSQLRDRDNDILQCGDIRVLGVRQPSWRLHPYQLHSEEQLNFSSKVVPHDDQFVCPSPTSRCRSGKNRNFYELPFINLFRNLECSVNLEAEEVS